MNASGVPKSRLPQVSSRRIDRTISCLTSTVRWETLLQSFVTADSAPYGASAAATLFSKNVRHLALSSITLRRGRVDILSCYGSRLVALLSRCGDLQ